MPSHSAKQAKVMSAIAHGWHPTGKAAGIPLKVAKEFHAADAGHKYGKGMAEGGDVDAATLEPFTRIPMRDLENEPSVNVEDRRGESYPLWKKWFDQALYPREERKRQIEQMRYPQRNSPGLGNSAGFHDIGRVPKLARGGLLQPPKMPMPFPPMRPFHLSMRAPGTDRRGFVHMEKGGFIDSKVPGRTDKHYVKVHEGSYVLPADHVAALGEDNNKAGAEVIRKMFAPGEQFGPRLTIPKFAGGGAVEPVPIVVAGGEVVIPPVVVKRIGRGDLERGHQILDKWVLATREKHIKKLKSLKPPKGAK